MSQAAFIPARDLGPVTAPARAVGGHAARGAAWTFAFSLFGKLLAIGTQFALAWILVPDELGLVGLTVAVMSFTAIVGGNNLKNVLVQRPEHFRENASHVFWFAFLLNGCAAAGLALCAPLAGVLFREPRVVPVMLVAALAIPVQSLGTVYLASLHCHLRFGRIAGILFVATLTQNVTAVLLAFAGFGAYSVIVPMLVNAVLLAVAFRLSAGPVSIARIDLRRSLALCAPVGWLIVSGFFVAIVNSGANVVIGLVQKDTVAAGYYHWGTTLSCQTVFLLVTNLQGVLFPVLARLNGEPARQLAGVCSACRVLLAIVAPVCVLQALLAGPVIELVFREKWLPAVPVVQWLSLGLMTQPFSVLATALLMARGQFRRLALVNGSIGFAVLGSALLGAVIGDHSAVATSAGSVLLIANLLAGLWVFRNFGADGNVLFAALLPPLLMAGSVGLAGWFLLESLAGQGAFIRIVLVMVACGLVAWLSTKALMPGLAGELWIRLRSRKNAAATNVSMARQEEGEGA